MTTHAGMDWIDADRYGSWLAGASAVHDSAVWPAGPRRWTERHLQCVWYDERLRPAALQTLQGEPLEVVQPGRWNLEAGPDFLGAEFWVGNSGRLVRGDVEIHIRPADWTRHRHGDDPRYAGVVLHVTYFPRSLAESRLPEHLLRISLQDALRGCKGFSFEDIDVGAYPHARIPATPRPCGEALQRSDPARWSALLAAAGRHRLRSRSRWLAARVGEVGDRHQVFYEETMAILGAKRNSTPFRKVAERLPLAEWPQGASAEVHYARLLGTAGLLPAPERLRNPEARDFVRRLWDCWFQSGGGADTVSGEAEWVLSGMRPLNHPLRRMAAAVGLFTAPRRTLDTLLAIPCDAPGVWVRRATRTLCEIPVLDYWRARQSLDSAEGGKSVGLLGPGRAAAILANVAVPLKMAGDPSLETLADALPSEDLGAPAREVSFRLFGRDHNPAFYARSGLQQQGLLAIHQDACLSIREGCEHCALAAHLRRGG